MTPASHIQCCAYKCPTRCDPDFGKPMGYEVLRARRIRAAAVISENRQQYGLGQVLRENGLEPEGNRPSLPAGPVRGCGLAAQQRQSRGTSAEPGENCMSGDNRALSLAVGPFCLLKLSEDKKITTLCILTKFFCPCSLIGSSYLISNIQRLNSHS